MSEYAKRDRKGASEGEERMRDGEKEGVRK